VFAVGIILTILGAVFVYGQKFQMNLNTVENTVAQVKMNTPRIMALESKTNSLERYILVQEEALRGIRVNQEETNKKLDMILNRLISK
jgi:capsule polysaccharide export protein KpsE/RkpR